MYLCKNFFMFKKLLFLFVCICAGSFVLATIILKVDFGNERILMGNLYEDYQMTVYKGIGILCVFLLPILMNSYKSIRRNKLLRVLTFFLWPVLIFVLETFRSSPQEIKNSSVVYFSVFACLLLGFIYFQRMIKKEK